MERGGGKEGGKGEGQAERRRGRVGRGERRVCCSGSVAGCNEVYVLQLRHTIHVVRVVVVLVHTVRSSRFNPNGSFNHVSISQRMSCVALDAGATCAARDPRMNREPFLAKPEDLRFCVASRSIPRKRQDGTRRNGFAARLVSVCSHFPLAKSLLRRFHCMRAS